MTTKQGAVFIGSARANRWRVTDDVVDTTRLPIEPRPLSVAALAVDLLGREVNAVTDNPLIIADSGDILYGGNLHAEPVGMAADVLALALAETGSMAERRIALRWAWPCPVPWLIWH